VPLVEPGLRKAEKLRAAELKLERAEAKTGCSAPTPSASEGDGAYYEVCYLGYGVFMGVVRESV
jgi:hypothetical protein